MKTAKDMMTPDPRYVQSGEELRDVVDTFFQNAITSAPVITPANEILGMMTELSLVKAFLKHHLSREKHEKVIHHKELLEPACFVKEDDTIDAVIRTMIKSPTHRILVTGANDKVVGIISPKDFLKYLVGVEKQSVDLKATLQKFKSEVKTLQTQLTNTQKILETYQKLYESTPIMMHSVSVDGKIIMANRKIHEVLGYEPGELVGKTIYDLYSQTFHEAASEGLRRVVDNGQDHVPYTIMRSKEGKPLHVDIATSALHDAANRFVGTISVSRPIDSEAILRAMIEALKEEEVEE